MKIDKKNWRHWLYLLRSAVFLVIASLLRPLMRQTQSAVLYGHKFNGNLKAFYDYYLSLPDEERHTKLVFLTLDPKYYTTARQIEDLNGSLLYLGKFRDVLKVARSKAIITDHGMHTLVILNKLTNIPFIDVWHGIPYKGFTPENFSFFKPYSEMWTTSKKIRELYEKLFELDKSKIYATGYARVDAFVNNSLSRKQIIHRYGLPTKSQKFVLIAPTWQQDDKGRSIVPFGMKAKEFFELLNDTAKKHKATIIFRAHLNASDNIKLNKLSNVILKPYSTNPVAEDYLYISDVLITDWSSISFDYLPLDRPTIFLNVPAPFKNGFTVGPEHRFGSIADSPDSLISQLTDAVSKPSVFMEKYRTNYDKTKSYIYGNTLDGKSAARYYDRLKKVIGQ